MDNPDDIRQALGSLAGSIKPGDMETARTGVHDKLRRRRRRTRIVSSIGAAALLIGGVLAFVSFDNSDEPVTLVGVDSTTTTTIASAADETEETPATTEPEASSALSTQPASQSESAVVVSSQSTAIPSPDGAGAQWAVPWRDGFLIIETVYEPQTLPEELPEDVVALFPEEVVELFADGLPPTVAEATEMLTQAGLLEIVTEIISSNPDASSAILGAPIGPPSMAASFTVDGTTWESVEMTLPDGIDGVQSVVSVGDRLAVLSDSRSDPSGQVGGALIATTTDLATWTVQPIVGPPLPIELPSYVNRYVGVQSLVANESGWIVSIFESINVDVESLLPADVIDPTTAGGFGYGTSDEGVEIYSENQEEGPFRYTWEELGVPTDVVEVIQSAQSGGLQLWTATWDGTPVRSELDAQFDGSVLATDSGFLSLAEQRWFSDDGVAWTAVDLPGVGYVSSSIRYDGGVVIVGTNKDGLSAVYRVDPRGESAELVSLPDLPKRIQNAELSIPSNGAIVFDANVPEVNTDPLVLRADGFELTISFDNDRDGFELRDASGEVVVSESSYPGDQLVDSSFRANADGWSILDPESGDVLVVFPTEVVEEAWSEQSPPEQFDYDPEFWLLATPDGERFIVEQLAGGPEFGPTHIVVNGDTMLVGSGGEWSRYNF